MLSSTLVALAVVAAAHAVSIEFESKHVPAVGAAQRANFASKAPGDPSSFDFGNLNDVAGADIYVATIQVGGQNYVVQMDTGSSDLWLDTSKTDTSSFTSTGMQTALVYGDGTVAEGPILISNVTFGGFSVPQAFISAAGSNATTNGDTGLLGVGPPLLSQISDTLQGSQFNGKTVLENIFDANPSEPNLITFMLSRSLTTGTTSGGVFTIGEVSSDLQNVTSAPKLPVVSTNRWVVLMDGIIVNGKNFSGDSSFNNVPGQTAGQTLANLDTGTSFSAIPRSYADAIYNDIPGSQFIKDQGIFILPCNAEISLSFVFGGVAYPIHPIDTIAASLGDDGQVFCFSGFPVGDPDNTEDLLLGDSFLRNVYSLFDFGSFTGNSTQSPFIQLLSVTDANSANSEFQQLSQQRNQSLTNSSQSSPSGNGGNQPSSSSAGKVITTFVSTMFASFAVMIYLI